MYMKWSCIYNKILLIVQQQYVFIYFLSQNQLNHLDKWEVLFIHITITNSYLQIAICPFGSNG
jgi:hypothetical protein